LVVALSLAIGSWLIVSRGWRLIIVAGLLAIVLAWVVTSVLARRSRRGRTAGTTRTGCSLFVLGIVRGINGTEHQFGALKMVSQLRQGLPGRTYPELASQMNWGVGASHLILFDFEV
jgi:hypothetical protein